MFNLLFPQVLDDGARKSKQDESDRYSDQVFREFFKLKLARDYLELLQIICSYREYVGARRRTNRL
jgi:hypothetical protein